MLTDVIFADKYLLSAFLLWPWVFVDVARNENNNTGADLTYSDDFTSSSAWCESFYSRV